MRADPDLVRAALLVAPTSFESFYSSHLGLDPRSYVDTYRNDFVWTYAEALREHGVELVAYVPSNQHSGVERAPDGFAVRFVRNPDVWRWLEPGVRLARTPIERYTLEAAQAQMLLTPLRVALATDAVDVLYVQEYWTGRFDVLAHRSPVPVVAGEHGGSGGLHVHTFKRSAFARAAAITVQSTAERRRLERYGCRAELVTNGIDTDFFVPAPSIEREPRILVVARLIDAQKRISDLIAAMSMLPPHWSLDIVGRGPDEAMLRDRADRSAAAERIHFRGWVGSREELRVLYQRCGVFALPSQWEAVTLALLEAMACGAPPVVTPLSPFLDVISPGINGLFVPLGDPPSLAEAIGHAYAARASVGAAARSTVHPAYARATTMARLAAIIRGARRPARG